MTLHGTRFIGPKLQIYIEIQNKLTIVTEFPGIIYIYFEIMAMTSTHDDRKQE